MSISKLRSTILIIVALFSATFISCDNNSELWNELPKEISEFINQYFPNSELNSFSESSTTYHVRITNGPGMTFDKDCNWEAVNGYGMPLPEVLLFDQLPPALYTYLEETENLGNVFCIERDKTSYNVVLLDSTLKYDISTQEITGSDRQS